jgi:hypothetical protein
MVAKPRDLEFKIGAILNKYINGGVLKYKCIA